jgi:hypothetical protein
LQALHLLKRVASISANFSGLPSGQGKRESRTILLKEEPINTIAFAYPKDRNLPGKKTLKEACNILIYI